MIDKVQLVSIHHWWTHDETTDTDWENIKETIVSSLDVNDDNGITLFAEYKPQFQELHLKTLRPTLLSISKKKAEELCSKQNAEWLVSCMCKMEEEKTRAGERVNERYLAFKFLEEKKND